MRQQINADTHQHRRRPPPPVDILFEEYLPRNRVRHQVSEADAGATRLRFR